MTINNKENHIGNKLFKGTLGAVCAALALSVSISAKADIVTLNTGNGVVNDGMLSLQSDERTIWITGGTFKDIDADNVPARADSDASVVQTVDGLGLIRPGETDISLDGSYEKDLLIFEFDELVSLVSITFSNVDDNDDFDFFLDTNGDGILERVKRDILINIASGTLPGTNVAEVALANLLQATGTIFGIGADGFDDDFFVSAINFSNASVSEVPIPGALPLFATAIAGFSISKRKKRKS